MNEVKRIKMIKAMEFIVRQINDEDVFNPWLMLGVADGDIQRGDLSVKDSDADDLYVYDEDNYGAVSRPHEESEEKWRSVL